MKNELLKNTKTGDDIDILINLIYQMTDFVDDLDGIGAQIPDPTCHCKYWEDVPLMELVKDIEDKYKGTPRLEIPAEFDTCY